MRRSSIRRLATASAALAAAALVLTASGPGWSQILDPGSRAYASPCRSHAAVQDSRPFRYAVPPPVVKRSWYFAEGTTAYGFEEYICVQNPAPQAATVQAKYMMSAALGSIDGEPFVLEAFSRATINVADMVPAADVSVRIDADADVVCERSMYWGGRIEGHDSIGVTAPSSRWYLAEGCTNYGFEEYLAIQNPSSSGSTVTITYNTGAGPRIASPVTVEARSRRTIRVNDFVPGENVSISLSATRPVVAERSMYWDGRRGGHASIGTTAPAGQWFLAEGSTKWGFDTYILVQNPTGADATVRMTFLTEAGPVQGPDLSVKAGSRQTLDARSVIGSADFSTSVNSKTPIICERAMYWNNGTGKAGHDTIGVKQSAYNCYLAEGTTLYGFETYLLIANPNPEPNDVVVQYMTPHGVDPGGTVTIAPYSRTTIDVNAAEPGTDVSIQVSGNYRIAAERAMYWNRRGGGHDSIGYMSD
jgi:hypothetical protein